MSKENPHRLWFTRITNNCNCGPYSKTLTESIHFGAQQASNKWSPWAEINFPADWYGRCKLELACDHWDLLLYLAPVLQAFAEDTAHRLQNRIHKPISPEEICALLVQHGFVETDFCADENLGAKERVINCFQAATVS